MRKQKINKPMAKTFLTAEWRKLAMANYAVEPQLLQQYLPFGTELDCWQGTCYVSLVGFLFRNTRLLGVPIPFHTTFEEVNLRFYVRYRNSTGWKRGVVFIKEIVPKAAITLVANTVYGEHYQTLPMQHGWQQTGDSLQVTYRWKYRHWQEFSVSASAVAQALVPGSEEEFITEHYWGYTRVSDQRTSEYEVVHPRWEVYPVTGYQVAVDFGRLYGEKFDFLSGSKPGSVLLAEGSEVLVRRAKTITARSLHQPGMPA
jgi:uncharacterized protein